MGFNSGFKGLNRIGDRHQTLKDETSKVLHSEHSFAWCWNLDTSEVISEISGKFWNVVLGKDEDQLDKSCETWRIAQHQGGEEYPTYNKKKEG